MQTDFTIPASYALTADRDYQEWIAELELTDGFPARLRWRRLRTNLSQREIARAVGVSSNSWSHWERGLTWPTGRMRQRVAAFLGCTVADLFPELTPLPPAPAPMPDLPPPLRPKLPYDPFRRLDW